MTVEELFENYKEYTALTEGHFEYLVDEEDFKKALIEFAKYHVQKALEKYTEKLELERVKHHYPPLNFINKTDLKSVYPLENIK